MMELSYSEISVFRTLAREKSEQPFRKFHSSKLLQLHSYRDEPKCDRVAKPGPKARVVVGALKMELSVFPQFSLCSGSEASTPTTNWWKQSSCQGIIHNLIPVQEYPCCKPTKDFSELLSGEPYFWFVVPPTWQDHTRFLMTMAISSNNTPFGMYVHVPV